MLRLLATGAMICLGAGVRRSSWSTLGQLPLLHPVSSPGHSECRLADAVCSSQLRSRVPPTECWLFPTAFWAPGRVYLRGGARWVGGQVCSCISSPLSVKWGFIISLCQLVWCGEWHKSVHLRGLSWHLHIVGAQEMLATAGPGGEVHRCVAVCLKQARGS